MKLILSWKAVWRWTRRRRECEVAGNQQRRFRKPSDAVGTVQDGTYTTRYSYLSLRANLDEKCYASFNTLLAIFYSVSYLSCTAAQCIATRMGFLSSSKWALVPLYAHFHALLPSFGWCTIAGLVPMNICIWKDIYWFDIRYSIGSQWSCH